VIFAALLVATGYLEGGVEKLTIPLWVVLSAHAAIALGTISGGWRIVRTMGHRITELRPARGFAAEAAAAVALFGSTAAGAPGARPSGGAGGRRPGRRGPQDRAGGRPGARAPLGQRQPVAG
jgi:hypothetical protein